MNNSTRIKYAFLILLGFCTFGNFVYSQCNQIITVNSYNTTCDGNGVTTVDINLTILFGNGNNSVSVGYNLNNTETISLIIEDDLGDVFDIDYQYTVPSCNAFSISVIAWTNPSAGGSNCTIPMPIVIDITLPVIFGKINTNIKDDLIQITWTTHSEINNEKFIIERSNARGDYYAIGAQAGSGNTNQLKEYIFVDEFPNSGINYYRIKQVDYDGNFTYSDIVQYNFEKKETVKVFPNPCSDFITISRQSNNCFYFVNEQGEIVVQIESSDSRQSINISHLPKGRYFIIDDAKNYVESFVKY